MITLKVVHNADEDADEALEDVGGAGLWQKPDPIKQVHTCPQSEQDHA